MSASLVVDTSMPVANVEWWVRRQRGAAHLRRDDGREVCGNVRAADLWAPADDSIHRCGACAAKGRPSLIDLSGAGVATYRQLDYWTRVGYLHPTDQSPGSGVPRVWPDDELLVAATMARLVAAGLTPEAAHRVARGHDLAPGIEVTITALGAS